VHQGSRQLEPSPLPLPACAKPKPAPTAEPIKIGVLLPFTGAIADYGPLCKDGVELRFEQANYQVAGRPVKLIIEDDATDASIALEKAKKLVEVDRVGLVIGPIMSSMAMALAVADYVYVISKGVIVHESAAGDFKENEAVKSKYLGVAG